MTIYRGHVIVNDDKGYHVTKGDTLYMTGLRSERSAKRHIDMLHVKFDHIKAIEGVTNSMSNAINRKRKTVTLHADELPRLLDALNNASALMDSAYQELRQ